MKRAAPKSMKFHVYVRFVAVFLPVLLVILAQNVYTTSLIQSHAVELTANTLSLFDSQMSLSLTYMDRSLLNTNIDSLYHSSVKNSRLFPGPLTDEQLRTPMRTVLNSYSFLDGVFFSSADSDRVVTTSIVYDDLKKKREILNEVTEMVQRLEQRSASQWRFIEIDGNYYIIRILRLNDVYIGAWMQPENLIAYLVNAGKLTAIEHLGLVAPDGTPLFSEYPSFAGAYARLARKNTPTDTLVFSEGGVSYTAVLTQLSTTPLSAVAFMTTTGIVRGLPALHLILIFLSVFAMLLMLLTLHRTLQTMLQPTNEIVAAMRNLGKGDFSIRFQNKKTYAEYQIIGNAFNDMVSEIQQLKIQAYEEKLHKEKAELRFLQLQLTPHFFINNLNVIYSLAQVQDYAAIGDMVMALTDYFRYAMRPISQMVLLADEIQHVNNYLAIQRMRYKNRFAVEIDCPPEHAACSVPLFVLQTFVENSLKYAFLGDNRVLIHIAVSADARLETLQIAIDDNGPGFPEAILSGNWEQLASSGHIGLDNLQSRLKLLFADRAGLSLSNRPEGGAHVGITMPYIIGGSYVPSSLG